MFSHAEAFWKLPNLYDLLGAIGVLVGIASIWFAWWLARRDIEARIHEATLSIKQAVARVADSHLQIDLAELVGSAKIAREAVGASRWERAIDHLLTCQERLSRIGSQQRVTSDDREALGNCYDLARSLAERLTKYLVGKRKTLPADLSGELSELIDSLSGVAGRMRDQLWEIANE